MKNITFLLGAGASYYACPIWKEQGEKMVELATKYLNKSNINFNEPPRGLNEIEKLLWDIGYFGEKALKYGTIDTYAKKLYLNQSPELSRLKLVVSVFFTIWHLTNDKDLKKRSSGAFDEIDKRFITLLAALVERKDGSGIMLNSNVRFVTWNYDLQLEFAYKSFLHDNASWDYVSQNLSFRITDQRQPLQICHLNGYHGFYVTEGAEINFIDLSKSNDVNKILESIGYVSTSQERRQLQISNHINYAWENNHLANYARSEGKRIFSETDILIIIGYSFPNFNKEIDKALFGQLKGRITTIYYQDPNASETFITQLVDPKEANIICEKMKMDNFYLPYYF